MARYPALIEPGDGGFTVSFRDIPEALTCGDTQEEAQTMASDALLTAMEFYFEDQRAVPPPSPAQHGEVMVDLPASAYAKVLLLNEIVRQRITQVELSRRMGVPRQEVARIVNLGHATKIDTLAAALRAVGKDLVLGLEDATAPA
ncbi:antitoxin [Bordetella genomosp. 1]|uniref:Antitoxin n=1 Tax=Bordetella genomosp. 1 TaxID=1395607 RepID=A0A261SQ69_9BORD|nr:type II toxin-antitoxin system HicB family antitoxin [Bordetella genomosp. 1]OZI39536.1 antitoxin [Bordetella genomosp. 1]